LFSLYGLYTIVADLFLTFYAYVVSPVSRYLRSLVHCLGGGSQEDETALREKLREFLCPESNADSINCQDCLLGLKVEEFTLRNRDGTTRTVTLDTRKKHFVAALHEIYTFHLKLSDARTKNKKRESIDPTSPPVSPSKSIRNLLSKSADAHDDRQHIGGGGNFNGDASNGDEFQHPQSSSPTLDQLSMSPLSSYRDIEKVASKGPGPAHKIDYIPPPKC
jgi:hypothetical protein